MSLLQYAERLYSLDTLDTRFINSSKTLPPQIDPARSSRDRADYSTGRKERDGAEEQSRGASPPRWRTPEFAYHGLIFLVIVPFMFKTAYDVSKRKQSSSILELLYSLSRAFRTNASYIASHPEYTKFAPLLSPGWIPGRMVDNSDTQYASFRDNVPYLFIVMILHPLLRRLFNTVYEPSGIPTNSTPNSSSSPLASENARADSRLKQRVSFDVGFGILFLLALHGLSAPKVLLILYINYSIATRFKREYVPAATWIFNIGILFANELGKGYPYTNMADTILHWLAGPEAFAEQTSKENWGAVLDNYGGLIPRWEILFKVTILRLISFNLDYYWSLSRRGGSTVEVCKPYFSSLDRADLLLTTLRRNNLILQIYQNETGSTCQPNPKTFLFPITLHTPCTLLYT